VSISVLCKQRHRMLVDFIITTIDWGLLYIFNLFIFINGIGPVIMHFRCKLGMCKTTLKQTANINKLYTSTSQLVFFDLMCVFDKFWFTHLYLLYSKGLKCLALLIIETYTLTCSIFKISSKSHQISFILHLFLISYLYQCGKPFVFKHSPKWRVDWHKNSPKWNRARHVWWGTFF
jgi:hypothetical protein